VIATGLQRALLKSFAMGPLRALVAGADDREVDLDIQVVDVEHPAVAEFAGLAGAEGVAGVGDGGDASDRTVVPAGPPSGFRVSRLAGVACLTTRDAFVRNLVDSG
jgi:hypothetical protein